MCKLDQCDKHNLFAWSSKLDIDHKFELRRSTRHFELQNPYHRVCSLFLHLKEGMDRDFSARVFQRCVALERRRLRFVQRSALFLRPKKTVSLTYCSKPDFSLNIWKQTSLVLQSISSFSLCFCRKYSSRTKCCTSHWMASQESLMPGQWLVCSYSQIFLSLFAIAISDPKTPQSRRQMRVCMLFIAQLIQGVLETQLTETYLNALINYFRKIRWVEWNFWNH